ncbi:MAG: dTDP-4-dehydrorhamnose reductase [Flavisolibacter sp.]|jgi:dTDP-4-dehydrorhamnose reductase|nr:dTDP-4-dehydrorhamnose reductase [Flavisolibacter sp.]
MKILVTGSNGQLGSELKDLVTKYQEHEFVFLDRQAFALDQPSTLEDLFILHQPQYFINCAAYTAVDKAEEESELAMMINATTPGLIAGQCKKHHCKLIHISTDYVFNGQSTSPFKITDATGPQNVYGKTKLEGERRVMAENPDALIIRTSWVYSSYGKNFVKTMLRLMNEKDQIQVVNDQVGAPTYAADLAEAILNIIFSDNWHPGIYHFSNEGMISWYQFAIAIKENIKSSCEVMPILTSGFPTPAKRPAYSVMDLSGIQNTFHLKTRDWVSGLLDCLQKMGALNR